MTKPITGQDEEGGLMDNNHMGASYTSPVIQTGLNKGRSPWPWSRGGWGFPENIWASSETLKGLFFSLQNVQQYDNVATSVF